MCVTYLKDFSQVQTELNQGGQNSQQSSLVLFSLFSKAVEIVVHCILA